VQCNADKTGHHLKSSAKNMQGNRQPLKNLGPVSGTLGT